MTDRKWNSRQFKINLIFHNASVSNLWVRKFQGQTHEIPLGFHSSATSCFLYLLSVYTTALLNSRFWLVRRCENIALGKCRSSDSARNGSSCDRLNCYMNSFQATNCTNQDFSIRITPKVFLFPVTNAFSRGSQVASWNPDDATDGIVSQNQVSLRSCM